MEFSSFFLYCVQNLQDSLFQFRIAARWNIGLLIFPVTNIKCSSTLSNFWNQVFWFTYENCNTEGHASLSSCSIGCSNQISYDIFRISIRHNNRVIFCSHVNLHSFPRFRSLFVNEFSGLVSSNKRNGFYIFMVADLFNCIKSSIDNIQHSFR